MRLRVLTYNIHHAIGLDRKFAPDRIVEILRHHDADLALLQEVDCGAPRSRLLNLAAWLARQLGYDHHALGLNVYLKTGRYGNATLSRYPISRQRNIDLTIGRAKPRGAQHTRLELSDRGARLRLDVFNVHLSLTARVRRQQMTRLFAADDLRRLTPTDPCLVAGDMNDWRGTLGRHFFAPAGFACATLQRSGRPRAIPTYPSFAPTGSLDRIFFRGPLRLLHVLRSRLPIARLASDHLPIVAEFELPQ